MAKKSAPKRRRGFGLIAPAIKSAAAKHRAEKAEAEEKFPMLKEKLDGIKSRSKENRAAGRFDFEKSLLEMYSLVRSWDRKNTLDSRLKIVAKLRGVARRESANRFSVVVAYCSDFGERTKEEHGRFRRNVSRWSRKLEDAFEQEIAPKKLIAFLKSETSS